MNEKKEPKFWKGNSVDGFSYGIVTGFIVGVFNIAFIHIWHLGIFTWIVIWLFVGTIPAFKDTKTEEKKRQQEVKDRKTVVSIYEEEAQKKIKKSSHALVCPHCGSANVQLWNDQANIKKIKQTSSLNVNPLHPLTVFKHNKKIVKKHSKTKIAAGLLTGGTSLLITGTHDNKSHEYHCQNCGHVWTHR
ncbi:hypothetical protein ATX60_03990 [Oenococcus oeni]|uniref:hypothetical protein n=1 Tax=Oenococcus oeni TaxID=1247 RepID=UPI0008F950B9|nr:hypothetical protein [Oenococcus oeni]OIM23960.1 hypothetical protein ATX60_03990 [Oenococcus oeni]